MNKKPKLYCKKLYQRNGVQFAIDSNNILYIRMWGQGYKGSGCWSSWSVFDCSFRGFEKLCPDHVRPFASFDTTNIKPLPGEFVDTLDTVMDLYEK